MTNLGGVQLCYMYAVSGCLMIDKVCNEFLHVTVLGMCLSVSSFIGRELCLRWRLQEVGGTFSWSNGFGMLCWRDRCRACLTRRALTAGK